MTAPDETPAAAASALARVEVKPTVGHVADFAELDEAGLRDVVDVVDRWSKIQLVGVVAIVGAGAMAGSMVLPAVMLFGGPALVIANQVVDRHTIRELEELGLSSSLAADVVRAPYRSGAAMVKATIGMLAFGETRKKILGEAIATAIEAKKERQARLRKRLSGQTG